MTQIEQDLTGKSDAQIIEEIRTCESAMRAMVAKQAKFIAESERRGLHSRDGARSPSAWLRRLLNLQDRDARSRVLVARKVNPDAYSSGELDPVELPATTSALSEGAVSVTQARVIVDEIGRLPAWVSERQRADTDAFLAEQAKILPPRELRVVAKQVHHDLDPGGAADEEQRQVESRNLRLTAGRDGMTVLKGRLDRETGTKLRDALEIFSADRDSGAEEGRSEPQRRADAFAGLVAFGLGEEGGANGAVQSRAGATGKECRSGQRTCANRPSSHGTSAKGYPFSAGRLTEPKVPRRFVNSPREWAQRSPFRHRARQIRRAGPDGESDSFGRRSGSG